MKLTPQQKQIVDMLLDARKHCPTFELYQKDDRKRLSELRQMGYVFNEGAGYCEDPTHHHRAKVKLRQLVSYPDLRKGLTGHYDSIQIYKPEQPLFPLNKQEQRLW